MARERRLNELSILNVLFCLLVVLIHCLSHAVSVLDKLSWQYGLVQVVQRLSFLAGPGFFYLSGVKLTLPRERKQDLRTYYVNRVKHLLAPYLLAAAISYLVFILLGYCTFSPAEFLKETALGSLSAQFYFLITLIQFILLAPMFQWLVKRYDPVVLLPLALGITWLSSMYLPSILLLFNPDDWFPYGDRIFTSYLIYFLAGCCAGNAYPTFLALLKKHRALLLASTAIFAAADGIVSVMAFSGRREAPYLELIHTLYALSTIFLLHHWAVLYGKELARRPLLRAIDRASYLIYLYHCIVITLFNEYAPHLVGSRVIVLLPLRILVVYPATIAGCILWQRLWTAIKQKSN